MKRVPELRGGPCASGTIPVKTIAKDAVRPNPRVV